MITASHNPKEYNGFKAYGPDGAQLGPEDADRAAAEMAKVKDLPSLLNKLPSFDKNNCIAAFFAGWVKILIRHLTIGCFLLR